MDPSVSGQYFSNINALLRRLLASMLVSVGIDHGLEVFQVLGSSSVQ